MSDPFRDPLTNKGYDMSDPLGILKGDLGYVKDVDKNKKIK